MKKELTKELTKELHIVNVGVSIITNYERNNKENLNYEELLKGDIKDKKIYEFVQNNPEANSAELNAILKKIRSDNEKDEKVKKEYYFYFVGTNTPKCRLCVKIIKKILEDKKDWYILNPENKEIPGYYMEEAIVYEQFKEGISNLLEHLIKLIENNKDKYDKIYLNPTGGYKPHVIATAVAGFLTECDLYYLNEDFTQIITLPSLIYIPKENEIKVLKEICPNINERTPITDPTQIQELEKKYGKDLLKKLKNFYLIDCEYDERDGRLFRIQISKKGQLLLKNLP